VAVAPHPREAVRCSRTPVPARTWSRFPDLPPPDAAATTDCAAMTISSAHASAAQACLHTDYSELIVLRASSSTAGGSTFESPRVAHLPDRHLEQLSDGTLTGRAESAARVHSCSDEGVLFTGWFRRCVSADRSNRVLRADRVGQVTKRSCGGVRFAWFDDWPRHDASILRARCAGKSRFAEGPHAWHAGP
jgi:hypothetical protein